MKRRDVIGLVFAVAIFAIAGVLLYTQLAPAPKDTGISVMVPAKVAVPLSTDQQQQKMTEILRYKDFSDPQQCKTDNARCTGGQSL